MGFGNPVFNLRAHHRRKVRHPEALIVISSFIDLRFQVR